MTCRGPDCVDAAIAHGLCSGHLAQRKAGTPLRPKRRSDPTRGCLVASCRQKHEAKNLCRGHYKKALEYRLAADELAALWAIRACEICGRPFDDDTSEARRIDHDAGSGQVRGALCNRCNLGIGKFGHQPVALRAAARYLKDAAQGRLPAFVLVLGRPSLVARPDTATPCAFDGCDYPAYARRLCHAHWNQARRALPLTTISRRTRPAAERCAFSECSYPPRAHGLCHAHYVQQARGQPLRPVRRRTGVVPCGVDGCPEPRQTAGYCAGHYNQVYFHGEVQGLLRFKDPDRGCAVPWCAVRHKALGLCSRHYAARLRLGLTPDQTARAYSVQACPICGRSFDDAGGHGRHGDHDHVTGRFRAVICEACNLGLGLFDHDPRRLGSAAAYLERARHGG